MISILLPTITFYVAQSVCNYNIFQSNKMHTKAKEIGSFIQIYVFYVFLPHPQPQPFICVYTNIFLILSRSLEVDKLHKNRKKLSAKKREIFI